MSPFVKDVLCIKTLERQIGRKLDELELEVIELGEIIFVQKRNGDWISQLVPMYRFPFDIMVREADLAIVSQTGLYQFYYGVDRGPRD